MNISDTERLKPSHHANAVVVGVFMMLLALPGIAMLVGLRPPLVENRPATSFPNVSIEAMGDSAFYRTVDQAIDDAFPLRAAAITSRALIDFGLLGGSTNPEVVVGKDRWLYLWGAVSPRCVWTSEEVLLKWDAVVTALRARGIDGRFVIAPDKRTVYPQRLPSAVSGRATCTDVERPSMRAGMRNRATSTVDLWGPVLAAVDPTGPDTYYRLDSHWNALGAEPAVKALVDAIGPGIWASAPPLRAADTLHIGDLSVILGLPESELAPVLKRPGTVLKQVSVPVTVKGGSIRPIVHYTASGSGRVLPGTTLIVYDSFFGIITPDVASWFADSLWLHVDDLTRHPELARELPAFDRLILARAERLAYLTDYERVLTPLVEP